MARPAQQVLDDTRLLPRSTTPEAMMATSRQQRSLAMKDHDRPSAKRTPWNKGKFTGAKPPLRPKHVWSIRSKLQLENRGRDLTMLNLAIDSKLRGCDV